MLFGAGGEKEIVTWNIDVKEIPHFSQTWKGMGTVFQQKAWSVNQHLVYFF